HFSIGAFETLWADCREARSVADLQRALIAAAVDTPVGAWVRAVGYDHRLIGLHPTRGDLDAAVPDRPALLMHFSHHQCVANSRALAEAGITRGTPDPPGGQIARDKSGEPTGLLFERAMSRVETLSREAWEARFVEVARAASRRYAALGITAIQDAAVTPAMARRYAEARAAGALAIDVGELMVGSRGWFERPDDAAAGALKIFVDGGYRCAMRVRRDGATRTSGFLFYTREELTALLLAAWRADRSVVCHAIGNLGVETAVDAIKDAVGAFPDGRERVRIDHAIFLTPDLIARIADLGIWVVVQPSFLWDSRDRPNATPADPAILQRPFASAGLAGVKQAFSSDYPCGSNSPIVGIAAAVTRTSREGHVRRRTRRWPWPTRSKPTRWARRARRASMRSPAVSNPVSARICWSCRRTRWSARRRSWRRSACSRRGRTALAAIRLDPLARLVLLVCGARGTKCNTHAVFARDSRPLAGESWHR